MATINHKTYNEATETFKDFNVYDGKETLIFKVDGSEGNVGIGNSSPTATLDITGTLAVSGNSTFDTTTLVVDAAGDRVILGAAASLEGDTIEIHAKPNAGAISLFGRASDNGSAVSFRSNGATTQKAQIYGSDAGLGFATGTTQRVLIDTSGKVGIGTSGPTHLVQIYGASLPELRLGDASAQIQMYTNTTDGVFGTVGGSPLVLRTNATERMRITSTGNVGIGNSSPTATLDVTGTLTASGIASLGIGETTELAFIGDRTTVNTRYIKFVRASAVTDIVNIQGVNGGVGNTDIALQAGGGNVGIGTSSPSQLLHINASSGAVYTRVQNNVNSLYLGVESGGIAQVSSDASSLKVMANTFTSFETAGSERMRITSTGAVGIGTTSPATKLDVAFPSDGTAGAVFGYTGGTNNPRIFFNVNESTSKGQIIMSGSSGALDLGIGAGGTEIITLKGTGNVGIGTTSPADKLHIEADNGGAIRLERNDPTINNGNRIGGINFAGNESGTSLIGASIEAVAAENWVSPTSYGSDIVFYQASTGTSSYAERFRFRGSGGLTFNGDTAAANALDDYEEGTWTMGIAFGGSSTGVTFSQNTGTYTKIGRQVTLAGQFVLTSKGAEVGDATLTGLPFTSGSGVQFHSGVSFGVISGVTFADMLTARVAISATNFGFYETTNAGAISPLTNADFANNSQMAFSVTYFV
jgi:hypothetical protein